MNYDKAYDIYAKLAQDQFNAQQPPISAQGLVIRREGRYAIQTDNVGTVIPININIQKFVGRRVECSFNVTVYNVPFGYAVNLISITKLPV